MTKLKCPNVVAAAIKLAEHQKLAEGKDLWSLADALVKDCGDGDASENSRRRSGVNNGSKATLETASKELAATDLEYTARTLEDIRAVAIAFKKKSDRVEGLKFWSHKEAGNPEILQWILKTTPKREKAGDRWGIISVVTIREKAQQYRQTQKEAREREHAKAAAKLKGAGSIEDARKAKEEIERLKGMPPTGPGSLKPSDSALRTSANLMEIDSDLQAVTPTLQDILSRLRALKTINEDYAAGFVEDCKRIKAAVTHIENFLSGKSNVQPITA